VLLQEVVITRIFSDREGEKGKGKGGKGRNKELFPTRYKAPVFK
jgi:hypothetical protein